MDTIELKTTEVTTNRDNKREVVGITTVEEAATSPHAHILTTERSTIWVNREGHEGLLPLMVLGNGNTCKVPTGTDNHADQVPEWALNDNIYGAELSERRDFYVERVGEEGYRTMFDTDVIDFNDVRLNAWDHEGEAVIIDPSTAWRMDKIAEELGLDTTIEGWDAQAETTSKEWTMVEEAFDRADAENPPTDETLDGIGETMFGEVSMSQQLRRTGND